MNLPRHVRLVTRDAQEHAAGLSAWEQRYDQLSAGPFEGLLEEFTVGPVQVFRERIRQTVFESGSPRPEAMTLALARTAAAPGWFCGHELQGERAFMLPPGVEFELTAGADMELLAVCMDREHLAEAATRLHVLGEGTLPARPALVRQPTFDPQAFRDLLDCALDLVRERPQLLAHAGARSMFVVSLTDAVLQAMVPDTLQGELAASAQANRRIVTRSRDFIEAHAGEPVSVPQLCHVTGASRRRLQYAFEQVLHVSPVHYVRAVRLNRVRRELLAGCGQAIGDIAARWGFWHLSRFAADYRELFGELPSATRDRPAPAQAADAPTA